MGDWLIKLIKIFFLYFNNFCRNVKAYNCIQVYSLKIWVVIDIYQNSLLI